jgi:hypothetical protein
MSLDEAVSLFGLLIAAWTIYMIARTPIHSDKPRGKR